jgi:fatty acid elongase 3
MSVGMLPSADPLFDRSVLVSHCLQLVTAYNFSMSAASAVLFFFLARELSTIWSRHGFFDLFCDPHSRNTRGALVFFYYVNYLFKYIELIDTVFLCLRHKQLAFIHVYHHAITLMLCWTQLTVGTCMQWVSTSIIPPERSRDADEHAD